MIITVTLNPSVDSLYKIDQFLPNQLNRVTVTKKMAGGKGINAGRVASILGEKTLVTGFIGGTNGKFICNENRKESFKSMFINTKVETRNCIQIIDRKSKKTEINERSLSIPTESYQELREKITDIMMKNNTVRCISINGSLPTGCTFHYYKALITDIRSIKQDCTILLDTSGKTLFEVLESNIYPDIIKPNEYEIADYLKVPVTTNPKKLIFSIKNNTNLMKIPIIFISLGSKGCVVKYNKSYYYATQPEVPVISTQGSGDAMVGGILAAINNKLDAEQVIKYACAAGTANAMNLKTGFLSKNTFDKLISTIKIQKLS